MFKPKKTHPDFVQPAASLRSVLTALQVNLSKSVLRTLVLPYHCLSRVWKELNREIWRQNGRNNPPKAPFLALKSTQKVY